MLKTGLQFILIIALGLLLGLGVRYGYAYVNAPKPFRVIDSQAHYQDTTAKVIMYSTQWCPYCKKARALFKKHNIDFIERDIEQDNNTTLALYESLNSPEIPLIIIGDKLYAGFKKDAISEELHIQ